MDAEILVPTDGSDASTAAVEQGVELAAAFDATPRRSASGVGWAKHPKTNSCSTVSASRTSSTTTSNCELAYLSS
jgi:hypothetical protein